MPAPFDTPFMQRALLELVLVGAVGAVLGVTSNEPAGGAGDGNTAPDWEVLDAHHVLLRAERSGQGGGRVYTITITAADSHGNASSQAVTVRVPHN